MNPLDSMNILCKDSSRDLIDILISNRDISIEDIQSNTLKLNDPNLLKGLAEAKIAIKSLDKEVATIGVIGDYDVDGTFGTYIIVDNLRRAGYNVDYIIPDRHTDGYGLSVNVVKKIVAKNFTLIITCDNGIAQIDSLEPYISMGGKVIITDHHKPQPHKLEVEAIINPHQEGETYPFADLCGAGVALQFIAGLELSHFKIEEYLPFAAIATIADSVPLTGDNRMIVKYGLKYLKYISNPGINRLLTRLELYSKPEILPYHIQFIIAPRVNAAGRLFLASIIVEMLLSKDVKRIDEIIECIEVLNTERQRLTTEGLERVLSIIDGKVDNEKVIAVYSPDLHPSVIGIIASKVLELYLKPTIILTLDTYSGKVKGSGRSVQGFDMFENLRILKDKCINFGGHPMAVGLTIDSQLVREYFNNIAEIERVPSKCSNVDLKINTALLSLDSVSKVQALKPFGEGNPEPTFYWRAEVKKLLEYDRVLKFELYNNTTIICFNDLDTIRKNLELLDPMKLTSMRNGFHSGVEIEFIYTISSSEYRGVTETNYIAKSIRIINKEVF